MKSPGDPLNETLLMGTPYKAVARLGRGGMGEVVDAEHVALGKPVVVKLLHKDLARQPHQVERMRLEAQSLARIAHPNLVIVTDFGQTPEGRPYIVMERLRGRTLKEELAARGFVPPVEAIELTRQILAGLGAAHGLGLVHRDVKLENLFLCDPVSPGSPPEGPPRGSDNGPRVLKVLDFGIAKVVGPGRGGGITPAPSKYPTMEGVLLGTPRFLSPEQAMGHAVDARTDIYSTGIVLFTLLCGKGPFHDVTALAELLRSHAMVDAPLASALASQPIAPELDRAIAKALAKRPDDRYQTAAAFLAELEGIRDRLSLAPSQPKPPRWEKTEPLSSSTEAQRMAELAQAVLKQQQLHGAQAAPGSGPASPRKPNPPTAPMFDTPAAAPAAGERRAIARTSDMGPSPSPAKKFEMTAPLDPARANSAVLPFQGAPSRRDHGKTLMIVALVVGVVATLLVVAFLKLSR